MLELSVTDFQEKISSADRPLAVMVKTTWCPNCKALAPVFEKTADDLSGKADFNYLVVDDKRDLAKSLKIMGVPTILFYRHGHLMAKKVGAQSEKNIKNQIDDLLDMTPAEAEQNKHKGFFTKLFGKKK